MILIEPPTEGDFRMRYYNADGGEAEMCGNGARCAARYASDLGLGEGANGHRQVRFTAQPGLMEAQVGEMTVAVTITAANGFEGNISLELAQGAEIVHFVNTGVPHAVVVVPNVDRMAQAKLDAQGRAIRRHPRFEPDVTNADFVSLKNDGTLLIRTYERGVEAETLACGTGAVAAAVVMAQLGHVKSPVALRTHGGDDLQVRFELTSEGATGVVLEGPAEQNFSGIVHIDLEE